MHTSPEFKMMQTGSFNSLNYPEMSNVKPETIEFSYLNTQLFLDIRLELEDDTTLVIPHEHARCHGKILMRENWCASAANLRNIYMAANSYPLSCTNHFRSSLPEEGRTHTSDNSVMFRHKTNVHTHSTIY